MFKSVILNFLNFLFLGERTWGGFVESQQLDAISNQERHAYGASLARQRQSRDAEDSRQVSDLGKARYERRTL